MKRLNIGFVSTRFSGTDGVSLESTKWAHVFEEQGHQCFWYAGRLNRAKDVCYEVPDCIDDLDCAPGEYCGADGFCYAEDGCWSDADCMPGFFCADDGFCYEA